MTCVIFLIFLIVLIQFVNSIDKISTSNEAYVAFLCGKPAKFLQNNTWKYDFHEDCIKDEKKIVGFCQKSFPKSNILTAEPAVQKIKFSNWCDFDNNNCEVDVEIRPFKCLDKDFFSDALLLPRGCQFGHLYNQSECVNYKTWVNRAREQCVKQDNWMLQSYGMLFPCGESQKNIKPMFFTGVEFVCCPKQEHKGLEASDVDIYKNYLSNAVLETEQEEQKLYEKAEETLLRIEKEKESNIINDFKDSENDLIKLWKADPKRAKNNENNLISHFKTVYNALLNKFLDNQEQLLNFHDDRLEFIYNTKLSSALRLFQNELGKPNKTETGLYGSLRNVLTVIMNRKKFLQAELDEAKKMRPNVFGKLYKKLNETNVQINYYMAKLDQVPRLKLSIKKKIMEYFTNVYPFTKSAKQIKKFIYDDVDNQREDVATIIAKYRHHLLEKAEDYDAGIEVHYDLGLNNEDQTNHYAKTYSYKDKRGNVKNLVDIRAFIGIICGVLVAVVFILFVGSGCIIYHQKKRTNGYLNPKFTLDENRKEVYGFGSYNNPGQCLKNNRVNGYENFTYMATSHLGNAADITKVENSNLITEEETPSFR